MQLPLNIKSFNLPDYSIQESTNTLLASYHSVACFFALICNGAHYLVLFFFKIKVLKKVAASG
jgi:hypothetical protein